MSKTIYIYVLPFQRVVHVDVSHNVSNVIMEFFHIQPSHSVILNLLQTLPVFNYTVYFYTVQVRTVLTWFSLFSFWKTYFAKYAPDISPHAHSHTEELCPTLHMDALEGLLTGLWDMSQTICLWINIIINIIYPCSNILWMVMTWILNMKYIKWTT